MYEDVEEEDVAEAFLTDLYNELGHAEDGAYPPVSVWEQLEPIEQQRVRDSAPQLVDGLDMYVTRLTPVTEHHGWIARKNKSLRNKFPSSHYDKDRDTNQVDLYLHLEGERFEIPMTEYLDRYADQIVSAEDEEDFAQELEETQHWTRHFLQVHNDWSDHVWSAVTYGDTPLKERYESQESARRWLEPIVARLQGQVEQLLSENPEQRQTDTLADSTRDYAS